MANRGKGDATKACRGKSRLSPERQSPDQPDANATLLLNMREMMDEMRSDILSKFETTISAVVKREIVAALEPFEKKLASCGEAIADLERLANTNDMELSDLRANVRKLTLAPCPLTHEKVGHLQLLLISCQTPSDLRVSLSVAEKDHIREENMPATHQSLKTIILLYRGTVR